MAANFIALILQKKQPYIQIASDAKCNGTAHTMAAATARRPPVKKSTGA